MADYIDLVAVVNQAGQRPFLFQAPAWTYALKPGTEVVVETVNGEKKGVVVDSITVRIGREELDFIVKAMNATLPLKKVLGVLEYTELKYPEPASSPESHEESGN